MRRALLLLLAVLLAGTPALADDVDDRVKAARDLWEAGEVDAAIAALGELREQFPSDDRAVPLLAYLLYVEKEALVEAETLLGEYLEFRPTDDWARETLRSLAEDALDRGLPRLSRRAAAVLRRADREDPEHLYLWAEASFLLGQRGAVSEACRLLIARWPSFEKAYWLLARVRMDEGRYGEVLETWRRLLEESPRRSAARLELADVLAWPLRRYEEAEEEYRRVLDGEGPESDLGRDARKGLDWIRTERAREKALRDRRRSLRTLVFALAGGFLLLFFALARATRPR